MFNVKVSGSNDKQLFSFFSKFNHIRIYFLLLLHNYTFGFYQTKKGLRFNT